MSRVSPAYFLIGCAIGAALVLLPTVLEVAATLGRIRASLAGF